MEGLIDPLLNGLFEAVQPFNLGLLVLGCVLGLFIGALGRSRTVSAVCLSSSSVTGYSLPPIVPAIT